MAECVAIAQVLKASVETAAILAGIGDELRQCGCAKSGDGVDGFLLAQGEVGSAGLAGAGGPGLLEGPAECFWVPLQGKFAVAEVAARQFEPGLAFVVAAIETQCAVHHTALGRAAEDVVDGIGVGGRAGALAMMVDEQDGGVMVGGHALQGAHHEGHFLLVHLVAAAQKAAERIDDDQLKADVQEVAHLGQAVVGDRRASSAEFGVAVAIQVNVHARCHFLDTVGQAVGGVFEGQIVDFDLWHGAVQEFAAAVSGNQQLHDEPGLTDLGATGEDGQADRHQFVDHKFSGWKVSAQQVAHRIGLGRL